jgi:hypothetical protein
MKSLKCFYAPASRLFLLFCLNVLTAGTMLSADLETTTSSMALNDILANTGKSVGAFFSQFESVTCVEKVTQEKIGKEGKAEYAQKSTFDYLVFLNLERDGLQVDESRLQQGKKGNVKNIPLLITSGLPTLLLVFHPYYQESFRYQLEGNELANGGRLEKIQFQHVPGTKSTTALRLRGKDYPLDIQGIAWIDPETGVIRRITARLITPVSDLNVQALEMEVRYEAHKFSPGEGVYWLPSTATIGIQSERQIWRNTHQYSNYKRFTVNAENTIMK